MNFCYFNNLVEQILTMPMCLELLSTSFQFLHLGIKPVQFHSMEPRSLKLKPVLLQETIYISKAENEGD